jgi:hypothetical protein
LDDVASSAERVGPPLGTPTVMPIRPTSYVLDDPLHSLGTSATVWRETPRSFTELDVKQFARALAVVGATTRTPIGYEARSDDASLTFSRAPDDVRVSYARDDGIMSGSPGVANGSTNSGSATARAPVNAIPPSTAGAAAPPTLPTRPVPVDVPSARGAAAIAHDVLSRAGALAYYAWTTSVADAGGVAIACPVGVPCPTQPPVVTERTVTFTPTLHGIPINAASWTVTVGAHRQIVSIDGSWATFVPIGAYPLRSVADVFNDLQHGRARYVDPQPLLGTTTPDIVVNGQSVKAVAHINGVTSGLAQWWGSDNGTPARYVVPTYRFQVRQQRAPEYRVEVLALDPAHLSFVKPSTVSPSPGSVGRMGAG